MILGFSTEAFTHFHVVISLLGIATGLMFMIGLLGGRWLALTNLLFLLTTIATSVTGFLFPIVTLGPPHYVGGISLVLLAIALLSLYSFERIGMWNKVYAACAIAALYLNCFVGVVQAFQKQPFLNRFAPTQTEPPFLAAQGGLLLLFLVFGYLAVKRTPRAYSL